MREVRSSWPLTDGIALRGQQQGRKILSGAFGHSMARTRRLLRRTFRKADLRKWPSLTGSFSKLRPLPMTSPPLFTLGARGSPLALMQANETRRRLAEAHGWEIERIALQVIRTTGDRIQDRPLAEAGGKGLFTKEIDAALLAGAIDAAAHSAKDLPSLMPEGVV